MNKLLTKSELSELLSISTRTLDRWRSVGIDLGEVQIGNGYPRFNPEKVQTAITNGMFKRKKSKPKPKNISSES